MRSLTALLIIVLIAAGSGSEPKSRAAMISGGTFTPLYGVEKSDQTLVVNPFAIDRYPVTNKDFLDFVANHPAWAPDSQRDLLSDSNYLKHWEVRSKVYAPLDEDLNKPVVHVPWFAAADFCASRGGRLPTVLEWEFVAAASETSHNASRDPVFVQQLLKWYSRPSGGTNQIPEIGKSAPNAWGVHDLHGLVWEWTADFNSVFVAGDNRREGEELKNLFCGAGAASGTDKANYAAFMRYALRNSLKGRYTTANLGFRCAYDNETSTNNPKAGGKDL